MFPEYLRIPVGDWINSAIQWLVANYSASFQAVTDQLLGVLVALEQFLRTTPWWVVLIVIAAISLHATRRIGTTLVLTGLVFTIGLFGLWDLAMQTLAMMLISLLVCIVIGLPGSGP